MVSHPKKHAKKYSAALNTEYNKDLIFTCFGVRAASHF